MINSPIVSQKSQVQVAGLVATTGHFVKKKDQCASNLAPKHSLLDGERGFPKKMGAAFFRRG
jgi:hypothetical protein